MDLAAAQSARIEGNRPLLQFGERLQQVAAGLAEEDQEAQGKDNGERVPARKNAAGLPNGNRNGAAHGSALPSRHTIDGPRPAPALTREKGPQSRKA